MSNESSKQENLTPSSERLSERAREIWLAGLGALSSAEKEGVRLYQELVEKGKSFEAKGRPRVEEIGERTKDVSRETLSRLETMLSETTERAFKRFGVPSREEMEELSKQVDRLTAKVEELTALLKDEKQQ